MSRARRPCQDVGVGVDAGNLVARPLTGLDIGLVGAALVAMVALTTRSGPSVTSYGRVGPAAEALVLVGSAGLLGAAAAVAALGASRRMVASLVAAGVAWAADEIVGWSGGPVVVRSTAAVLAPLLPAALLYMATAVPTVARLPAARLVARLSGASALAVSAGRALVHDPFLDRYCWANCGANSFVVWADRHLATDLLVAQRVGAVAAGLGVVGVSLLEGSATTALGRRRALPVLGPLMVAGAAEAFRGLALLDDPAEDPAASLSMAVFATRACALALVAAGAVAVAGLEARRQRAVARLARSLEAGVSGTFEASLQTSLADASVRVVYVLPNGQLVDSEGRTATLDPSDHQVVTTIARSESPVAYVLHDRSVGIGTGLGPAARLAIDNERLQAGSLAHLSELVASRARLVAAGDCARRDLERDLHDGVQQHVVALSFKLRMAAAASLRHGVADSTAALDDALSDTQVMLGELRTLARGIFPAVLVEAGLLPALRTLAVTSPIPLAVDGEWPAEMTAETSMAAYFAVATWVESRSVIDDHLRVTVRGHGPGVVLELISGSSVAAADIPVAIGDRVGAVGGTVRSKGDMMRIELPCGS